MIYALLADVVVVTHFAFILYVIFGGLLIFWRPATMWVHIPTAIYGVLVEWVGWICPLTPLEIHFRKMAGQEGYAGGFVDQYLLSIIYYEGITRRVQFVLGGLVLLVNVAIYAAYWFRGSHADSHPPEKTKSD